MFRRVQVAVALAAINIAKSGIAKNFECLTLFTTQKKPARKREYLPIFINKLSISLTVELQMIHTQTSSLNLQFCGAWPLPE